MFSICLILLQFKKLLSMRLAHLCYVLPRSPSPPVWFIKINNLFHYLLSGFLSRCFSISLYTKAIVSGCSNFMCFK